MHLPLESNPPQLHDKLTKVLLQALETKASKRRSRTLRMSPCAMWAADLLPCLDEEWDRLVGWSTKAMDRHVEECDYYYTPFAE